MVEIKIREGMAKLREPGFYWVRRLGESQMRLGRWTGLNWFVDDELLTDDDFAAFSAEQVESESATAAA